MVEINAQAEELNVILKEQAPEIYAMLSEDGLAEFFPHKGILGQTAEAKDAEINATIGQAFHSKGIPMSLEVYENMHEHGSDAMVYSPSFGQKTLREKWKEDIARKNPSLNANISLPVVTVGLTNALKTANELFVTGEVIVPDLFWGNYRKIFKHANMLTFQTFTDDGAFNVSGLEDRLNEDGDKKVVVLSSPNNPTGYTPTIEETEEITRVVREAAERGKRVVVISDDAYFGLVYKEGVAKESLFAKLADLDDKVLAIKVDGVTKEHYAWGERIGFITYGNPKINEAVAKALEDKSAGFIRGNLSNNNTGSQLIVRDVLGTEELAKQQAANYDVLAERYETVVATLKENPHYGDVFRALSFNSGYFMCVKVKNPINAVEVRKHLLDKYSTGTVALPNNIIRVAFSAVPKDKIPKLFDNLYDACLDVGNGQH
jgi:aspartate/methionine/tyrosine aminotransferase